MANELYGISILVSFTLFFSIIYLICYKITDMIKSRNRIKEIKAEKAYTYSVLNTCKTLSAAVPEEMLKQQTDVPEEPSAQPSEQTDNVPPEGSDPPDAEE